MSSSAANRAAGGAATTSPASVAIHTSGLSKAYGSTVALAGLDMAVPRGEVFGFLGPNGAGKTTAIKLLLGLSRPSAGEAWVLGAPAGDRDTRQRIGYLPELFRYQAYLTAIELLRFHCELARLPRASWASRIAEALELVGLTSRASARVGTFSKGMQQRVGLGVALLGSPELVFLDEPTSALDPVGRRDVRDIVAQLKARGTTVFLNSHLLSEVERVCDRVAVVNHGRVVATGTLAELLGSGGVRLRAGGLTAGALVALAQFGELTHEDECIAIAGITEERVPDVVSAAVAAGARVYAVEPHHQSLEERFMELVGEGER